MSTIFVLFYFLHVESVLFSQESCKGRESGFCVETNLGLDFLDANAVAKMTLKPESVRPAKYCLHNTLDLQIQFQYFKQHLKKASANSA